MKKPKLQSLLFFSVVALFNMAASFAHPITPTLFKGLHLADYMFGVALAFMMLGNFLFSPFWGKLSSHISSRNTLLVSCMGYALGQLFFAMARTQLQFVVARFLAGIFAGGIFVGILTYIVNTTGDTQLRGKYLAFSATLQAVCNSLGYFVGGLLGEINVYVAVFAQAIALGVCGLLFRMVCREDKLETVAPVTGRQLFKEANPFQAFVQGGGIMTASLVLILAVCALQNLAQTAFDQSFNYYVIDQIGLSTGYNGLIKFVMGIVTLIANSTVCVWLMQKTDTRRSMVYVLLSCTISITAVLFLRALTPFLLVNILFFALSSISIPLSQNLVAADASGGDSNLVMGCYNSIKSFGGIVGALIAGFTYVVSPTTPFVCCAVGFGLAVVCAIAYKHKCAANKLPQMERAVMEGK